MALGRKTGGRQKGTPNKAGADLRELARQYTKEATDVVVNSLRHSDADIRLKAAGMLWDRGYGRPAQAVTGQDGGPIEMRHAVEIRIVDHRSEQ